MDNIICIAIRKVSHGISIIGTPINSNLESNPNSYNVYDVPKLECLIIYIMGNLQLI